jgi:probable rRNA maturation factor
MGFWRMTPTALQGVAEVTGMNTMPLEPDSPDPDPLSSEQWQTDGGSHLDILIDRRIWPNDVIACVRPTLVLATDIACKIFDWPQLEVGALFGGDDRIRDLNHRFRGKDAPTNVLSFPSGDDGAVAGSDMAGSDMTGSDMTGSDMTGTARLAPGDIAIAFETLCREAALESKSVNDHLTHLWVHGLLHLMGHDHQVDDEADFMEAGEIRVLARLGIANPYAELAEDMPEMMHEVMPEGTG